MKIKKIEVTNFKAISSQEIELNGCSAIVTAGNNKGKTSMLRGVIDRFRGEKPELIIKDGENKGFNIIELTDGCRIEWKFTDRGESFAYITDKNIRMTQGVLSTIGEKYFGTKFDIDKFLTSGAKVQAKELQKIVGLDFTEIDSRYKEAYELRTESNRELKRIGGLNVREPEKVEKPNIDIIKDQLAKIKDGNEKIKTKWNTDNSKHLKLIQLFNNEQYHSERQIDAAKADYLLIETILTGHLSGCIDKKKALQLLQQLPKPEEKKDLSNLAEPLYGSTVDVESDIEAANEQQRKYDAYERELQAHNDWMAAGKKARKEQEKCDSDVKKIEAEKNNMIGEAQIPEDFEINEEGILYKGLPLSNNQISSSSKYIAALKLGSMVLGELRTMHFDASYLDKNSLSEIQKWADSQDLQLLIERPDFDGGEIKYEIIQK